MFARILFHGSLFFLAAQVLLSTPARAQYMFLDATGDGAHDSADVLNPNGPTTFDIWIRTDQNRDGSSVSCITEDGELTINSYEFTLRVTNGEVEWGTFSNHQPLFNVDLGSGASSTEFHIGFGGGAILPPGTYRLGSLSVTPLIGTPGLEFSPTSTLSGVFLTSFGSRCSGTDFDNTLKLGLDWDNTDGLAFGGVVNFSPILQAVENMVVTEDQTLDQVIHANDANGDPVTFHKIDGPSFMDVQTLESGNGSALGRIRLTPGPNHAGFYFATVGGSDGVFTGRADLEIQVLDVNHAPFFHPIQDVRITAGTEQLPLIFWTDPDGDATTVSVVSGPSYFSLLPFFGQAAAFGFIKPLMADAGRTDVVVLGVTDGKLRSETSFRITVQSAPQVDPVPDLTMAAGSVVTRTITASDADGDPLEFTMVSGPGFARVSTVDAGTGAAVGSLELLPGSFDVGWSRVVVGVSDGQPNEIREMSVHIVVTTPNGVTPHPAAHVLKSNFLSFEALPEPQGLALEDFNQDGLPDIAVIGRTNSFRFAVSLFAGLGNGFFRSFADLDLPSMPSAVAAGRLNADDYADVVVVMPSSLVSVFLGRGAGAFERSDYEVGSNYLDLVLSDLTGDMRPDMVLVGSGTTFEVHNNTGDGHFRHSVTHDGWPQRRTVATGDLNRDGLNDIVTASYRGGAPISVYLSRGGGALDLLEYPVDRGITQVRVQDVNHDGNPDVVAGGSGKVDLLLGNGSGGLMLHSSTPAPEVGHFELGDFDPDGRVDIAVAQPSLNTITVFRADGQGGWSSELRSGTGMTPLKVVSGDLDMDGHRDLVTANGEGSISVLLGRGNGRFSTALSLPTQASPRQTIPVDLNADSRIDLVTVGSNPSSIVVILQRSDGTFAPEMSSEARGDPGDAALADWNGDSILDLAYVKKGEPFVAVHWGDGAGRFMPGIDVPVNYHALGLQVGDVNHDHLPDLVVAPSSVLLNEGNGAFGPAITNPTWFGESITLAHINADEHLDLVGFDFYSFSRNFMVALGRGDGTFAASFSYGFEEEYPQHACLADMNHDGRTDLVVAHGQDPGYFLQRRPGHVSVMVGLGDGTFLPPATYPAGRMTTDLAVSDLNLDGYPDVAASDAHASAVSVFLNSGDGKLGVSVDHGTGSFPMSLALADTDRDGRTDVVTADRLSKSVTILHNMSAGPNRPPNPDAGGPYTGIRGLPVSLSATGSSDPDGEPLSFSWQFGDGREGVGSSVQHTYADPGSYRVILTLQDAWFSVRDTTSATIGDALAARAFRKGLQGSIPLGAGPPLFCIQLEPVENSYVNSELIPGSLVMKSSGTGSLDLIHATDGKDVKQADSDRNGIEEITVCFRREDLLRLLDAVRGRTTLETRVEGTLQAGAPIEARLSLSVIPTQQGGFSSVYPNPLNPVGVLTFHTSKAGRVRVEVMDVSGRRLGTILDQPVLPAGYHDIPMGGESLGSARLASGVYFYVIESPDGFQSGRFTVLK